jgi:hypothetical protein
MGSPKINYEKRDIGEEYEDTLKAKLKYADQVYAAEDKYGVKYARSKANMMEEIAPRLTKLYEDQIYPAMQRMDTAAVEQQRLGDVRALEQYGGRVSSAMEQADPETYALREELNRQALSELKLGGQLTGAQRRSVQQGARQSQAARGFGYGLNDEGMERMLEINAMEDRRRERQAWAQSQMASSAALGADVSMAILGRPGRSYNPMAVGQQAQGMGPGQLFNLESAYASQLHGQNSSQALQAARYNQQSSDALTGSIIGGIGSIAGGALAGCWVAREVYGNENPKWVQFFIWKETFAPQWLRKLYDKHGERFALFIHNKPSIKNLIRRAMNKVIGG